LLNKKTNYLILSKLYMYFFNAKTSHFKGQKQPRQGILHLIPFIFDNVLITLRIKIMQSHKKRLSAFIL
jgi:hypothetical protein